MLKVKSKGDAFAVVPAIIEIAGVELKVFIAKGEGAGNHWLNALYYNDLMVGNDNPLYTIVSNLVVNKELKV